VEYVCLQFAHYVTFNSTIEQIHTMLIDSLAIVAGFILLIWSADRFICGAAATANNLNVSPLVIGLTIVGFGTSAPEMIIAGFASIEGSPAMAIGNAIGSNIANIALVLGIAALIAPLDVHSRILKKELPLLLVATLLAFLLMMDEMLGRTDGIILSGSLLLLMWWVTRQALTERDQDILQQEYIDEMPAAMSMPRALFWLALGLTLLIISSKILVNLLFYFIILI